MSIEIHCEEHLAKVMTFALNNGCLLKLTERLEYLANYGENNICHLHYDWAPNSFALVMARPDGSMMWNGGLIYSGPGQRLDGSGPAYTVDIDPESGKAHKWGVHT